MPVYLFPGTACLNHDFTDLPDYRETQLRRSVMGNTKQGTKKLVQLKESNPHFSKN